MLPHWGKNFASTRGTKVLSAKQAKSPADTKSERLNHSIVYTKAIKVATPWQKPCEGSRSFGMY
jgi:hypothetical protein